MLPEQRDAIEALLDRSGRSFVPIRRSFVQAARRGGGAGPLAAFVSGRRRRALDLYLLLHALASSPPWDVELPAVVWARMLGLTGNSVGSVVSKQWTWLQDQGLIRIQPEGRKRRIYLLREDGSGRLYTHPGAATADGPAEGSYFHLPHAYWKADLQSWADLPTKALLLIACSLPDGFVLPREPAAKWYGVSPDTIRSGLRGLQDRGYLTYSGVRKSAPLTAAGYTIERHYTVQAPFRPWHKPRTPDEELLDLLTAAKSEVADGDQS